MVASYFKNSLFTKEIGSGSSLNDPELILIIQILAAKRAVREINFWGYKDITNTNRIDAIIKKIFQSPNLHNYLFTDF